MPVIVKNNNDNLNYNDFHAVFTCMQCDSPEQKAICLVVKREPQDDKPNLFEPSATSENEVSACKRDKAPNTAKKADSDVEIMK